MDGRATDGVPLGGGPAGAARVAAVVATLGLSPDLDACLDALRREGGEALEIVLVAQGGAEFSSARKRADRVLSFPHNLGFAAANDAGLAASERELVATVNDDVLVEPGWLAALVAALDRHPDVAAVQGVNLRTDVATDTGAVDGCGVTWNRWWQAVQVGRDAPPPPATAAEREVFGVSATAAIYRRAALEALAEPAFDPAFGSYYEDVDLACRLHRAGWRALLVPSARVRHAGSTSGKRLAERSELIYGNRYRVLARHLGVGFWPRLPWIWLRDVVDLVHALRGRGEHRPRGIVRGWLRALSSSPPNPLSMTGEGASGSFSHLSMTRERASGSSSPLFSHGDGGRGSEDVWLTAVVVHWHDEDHLRELFAAWPEDAGVEILVVDNSSSLGSVPAPGRLLDPGRNLGFGGGVNHGVARARAPWVMILNPDVRPTPGAVERLREAVAETDAAGLVPALESADGRSQHRWQLRPLPSPWALVLQTLLLDTVRGPRRPPPAGTAIAQPAAAALVLRRAVLAALGGFDEGYFPAWFEDVDLARRLAVAGHALRYVPGSRWIHAVGASVPALGYGPFLTIYYRNLLRYLRRHHGRGWSGLARFLLPIGFLTRFLVLPLRRPRRARSRAEAAKGLVEAIAAGLRE